MRVWILALMFFCGMLRAEENKILVCDNGREMLVWAAELIDHAEQSIDFCPCFCGGEAFQELFLKIEQRMQAYPKLRACILMSPMFLEPDDKVLINRLSQQYSRQFSLTYTAIVMNFDGKITATDNHLKILVVDETYFITGGTNYDYVLCAEGTSTPVKKDKQCAVGFGLPAGARDQDIVGRSATMARVLRQELHQFIALWKDYQTKKYFTSKDPSYYANKNSFYEIDLRRKPFIEHFETASGISELEEGGMQYVLSGPMHRPNKICEEYCRLIDGAEKEILIGNLHFAPVDPIFQSLLRAVNRGVKLTVITNGTHDQSPICTRPISVANTLFYIPVMYGKKYSLWDESQCKKDTPLATQIYEYSVSEVIYHKKVMIVDEKVFVIGSYNLALRSNDCDYELVAVIHSAQIAQKAKQVFAKDLRFSRPVTLQQARESYFDFFTAYEAELQVKFNNFF